MQIRRMTPSDVARTLGWAAAEGWNPGTDDADAFLAADPDGFLVGEIDGPNGVEPVAAISAVRHAPGVGFVGLYIVPPEQRGRGYGLAIWRAGVGRLSDGSIGLDAVPAQQDAYRSDGFELVRRTLRWAGSVADPPDPAGAVRLDAVDFDALIAYDAAVAGYPRPRFLRAWAAGAPTRSGAAILRGGAIAGYGVVRACGEGAKIGPLFADDRAAAAALVGALSRLTPARPLMLDIPEPNAEAAGLAADLGMRDGFETARMWRGRPPPEDVARTWGVATLELG